MSLHIRLTDFKLINRDKGVAIPECWQPVLDHATMMSSTHATPHQENDDETTENHEYQPTLKEYIVNFNARFEQIDLEHLQ